MPLLASGMPLTSVKKGSNVTNKRHAHHLEEKCMFSPFDLRRVLSWYVLPFLRHRGTTPVLNVCWEGHVRDFLFFSFDETLTSMRSLYSYFNKNKKNKWENN